MSSSRKLYTIDGAYTIFQVCFLCRAHGLARWRASTSRSIAMRARSFDEYHVARLQCLGPPASRSSGCSQARTREEGIPAARPRR